MCVALIMAGGRSERMRASLGPQHKGLVRIMGLSMPGAEYLQAAFIRFSRNLYCDQFTRVGA